jgi:phage gp36-like protein
MYALGLNAGAFAGISTDAQDAALLSASKTADSYLLKRFQLPLEEWGDDLRSAVSVIAAYRILATRGFSEEGEAEQLRLRYEDELKWLSKVSSGAITPIDVSDSSGGANTTDAAGEARDAAYVLAPTEGYATEGSFWDKGTEYPGGGGPPKRRGW